MRFSPLIRLAAIAAALFTPWAVHAQEDAYYAARMSARHDLELAVMDLRHFWQVEYPRKLRHLDAQIELTEAEIRALQERLRAYRPFDRFSTGRPLLVTIQDLKLCLLEAELRLRDLWAERHALMRFRSDHWRVLEHRVHEARLRVAAIEAEAEDAVR